MQNSAFLVWQNVSGSGMLVALYVCALLFLFFHEKETYKRILLIYLPLFWIAVLLLPVTYRVISTVIDEELYYRFFWMLPMSLVIAYTLVQLYHLYAGKYKKLLAVLLALVLIISGNFLYDNWRYSKAENQYHVPQNVVDICDLIHTEGREVMALFPMELMQYVRQYDGTICMPYGRNVLVADWEMWHPLYFMFEIYETDAEAIFKEAANYECSYIVAKEGKLSVDAVKESGYELVDTLHGYDVFYNDKIFQMIYN